MVTGATNLLWLRELWLPRKWVILWLVVQVLPCLLLAVQVDILGEAPRHLEQVLAVYTVRVIMSTGGLLYSGKIFGNLDEFGNTGSLQLKYDVQLNKEMICFVINLGSWLRFFLEWLIVGTDCLGNPLNDNLRLGGHQSLTNLPAMKQETWHLVKINHLTHLGFL